MFFNLHTTRQSLIINNCKARVAQLVESHLGHLLLSETLSLYSKSKATK